MKIKEVEIVIEKIGYIVAELAEVPEGVSKKTGKPYPAFANLKLLVHGQSDVTTFQVDMQYLDEIKQATADMEYLEPVKLSGIQNATGSFRVIAVERYKVS